VWRKLWVESRPYQCTRVAPSLRVHAVEWLSSQLPFYQRRIVPKLIGDNGGRGGARSRRDRQNCRGSILRAAPRRQERSFSERLCDKIFVVSHSAYLDLTIRSAAQRKHHEIEWFFATTFDHIFTYTIEVIGDSPMPVQRMPGHVRVGSTTGRKDAVLSPSLTD
jgi:hypothetical protein